MLSDQNIKKVLNKNIVIHPFNEDDLTPVGYNLNPSDFVYSIKSKKLISGINGSYAIPANDTVLILTKETVWASSKIGGTFHSKVGVVSKGFGHISTTLDPNWKGPLLISLNNPMSIELLLPTNKSFVTLIFYAVKTPAKKMHDNDPGRKDIIGNISTEMLEQEIDLNKREFLAKAVNIIDNDLAYREFEAKYSDIVSNSLKSIGEGYKTYLASELRKKTFLITFYILNSIILLILFFKIIGFAFIDKLPEIVNYFAFTNLIYTLVDKPTFFALIAIFISSTQATIAVKGQ